MKNSECHCNLISLQECDSSLFPTNGKSLNCRTFMLPEGYETLTPTSNPTDSLQKHVYLKGTDHSKASGTLKLLTKTYIISMFQRHEYILTFFSVWRQGSQQIQSISATLLSYTTAFMASIEHATLFFLINSSSISEKNTRKCLFVIFNHPVSQKYV